MWTDIAWKARLLRPVAALALVFDAQLAMAQQDGQRIAAPNAPEAVAKAPDTTDAADASVGTPMPANEAPAAGEGLAAESAATTLAPAQPAAVNERTTRFRTTALMAATIGGTLAYGRAKW